MKPEYELADTELGTVVIINEQIIRALLRDQYGEDEEATRLAQIHQGYTNSVAGGMVSVRGKHKSPNMGSK